MASNAKKGKKQKKKAVSLQSFLANNNDNLQAGYNIVTAKRSNLDWAAEVEKEGAEEEDVSFYNYSAKDQYILPSAPLGPNIDMAKLPSTPPYTAFLGNLPYDTEESDISTFFKNLKVGTIRLLRHPGENARLRGFGYVEFEDRQSLVDALGMSENYIRSSKIKIDIAGNQDEHGRPRKERNDRNDRSDRPDRTGGNWRLDREESSKSDDTFGDKDRERFGGDRERERFGDKDRDRFGDRDRDRFGDRDRDRFGDRDQERSSRFGGDRERHADDRFSDRGSRYGNRVSDRDRGSYDNRDGGYQDKGTFNNFSSDRVQRDYSNGYERRDGGRGGRRDYGSGYRNSGEERQSDFSRSSNFERSKNYGSQESSSNDQGSADDAPKERPRLVLQPRSKPLSEALEPVATSAIFGGAKPVDTAAREREIEERLAKERELTLSRSAVVEKRDVDREIVNKDERYDDVDNSDRNRRNVVGSQGRSPKTSVSVQSGGSCYSETDDEKSERSQPYISKPQSPKREDIKNVPAPLPKENVWAKRAQTMQTKSGDEVSRSHTSGSADRGSSYNDKSRTMKDEYGDSNSRPRSRESSGKMKEFETPVPPNYTSNNKFGQLDDSEED